jgi:NAD+ synthase (glutamine-hydrolysing)
MKLLQQNSVRLHQLSVKQGDPFANTEAILRCLSAARADGIRLAVFPELALTGVLATPEWLGDSFLRDCDDCLERIVAASHGIAILLGVALRYRSRTLSAIVAAEDGRRVVPKGSPLPFVPKLLSDANRFDGATGFLCAGAVASMENTALETLLAPFEFRDFSVGAYLGQSLPATPALFARRGVDLILRLDTLPYARNAPSQDTPAQAARETGLPFAQCGAAGVADLGKTLFVLSGGTAFCQPGGVTAAAPRFSEAALDVPGSQPSPAAAGPAEPRVVIEALETACRAQLSRLALSRVIVGASGGIDSALTAALYSRIVSPERLLLVNMPSRHNSQTTISLARQLAANIGCHYTEVPIEKSTGQTRSQIDGLICERPGVGNSAPIALSLSDAAFENVQARDRSGRVLSALCSAFGGVFTCNANKAEATVGYGTMYGDIAGFFAALADLWKVEVWEIARAYNREVFGRDVIPQGSIEIIPSAELSPDQNVDEGKGDPLIYPWHDRLFAAWTERATPAAPEDVLSWYAEGTLGQETGFDGDIRALFPDAHRFCQDLEQMWSLYNGLARAKRVQAPPVLSLKTRSYGFDLGAAQLPLHLSPRYHALKNGLVS